MLAEIPKKPKSDGSTKGTFGGSEKTLPSGITKKDSHYAQELARNKGVIEDVKKQAREEGNKKGPRNTWGEIIRKSVTGSRPPYPHPDVFPSGV